MEEKEHTDLHLSHALPPPRFRKLGELGTRPGVPRSLCDRFLLKECLALLLSLSLLLFYKQFTTKPSVVPVRSRWVTLWPTGTIRPRSPDSIMGPPFYPPMFSASPPPRDSWIYTSCGENMQSPGLSSKLYQQTGSTRSRVIRVLLTKQTCSIVSMSGTIFRLFRVGQFQAMIQDSPMTHSSSYPHDNPTSFIETTGLWHVRRRPPGLMLIPLSIHRLEVRVLLSLSVGGCKTRSTHSTMVPSELRTMSHSEDRRCEPVG